MLPKYPSGMFSLTLPEVKPLAESTDALISTWELVMYTISPTAISGASPGFRTVTKKLLWSKETNLCVPNGSWAAKVITPCPPAPVLTKSLLW